jgi:L-ascorbate metabolism protein UlaG (beta-lactamase superfamily)
MAPGIELKDLPPIDIILLSHNHRDHCDIQTLKELVKNQPLCLVGKGLKTTFTNIGFKNVQEKTWWEKETAKKDTASLTITFLPAWHWSNTGLTDVNKSLWGSWMIENGTTTIYFGGDSASEKHFSLIAENFPKIDVALLPIGPVSPREFTKRSHMDGIEAIKAFIDLKARIFIPIHWGTFRLGPDGFYDPIYLLQSEWQKHIDTTLKNKELKALQLGGICTL